MSDLTPLEGDYYFLETYLRQQGDFHTMLEMDAVLIDPAADPAAAQGKVLAIVSRVMNHYDQV